GREQGFEALAQRRGKAGGGAPGGDRDQYGIAVDNGRRGEIAQIRPVDDIDELAGGLQAGGGPLRRVERDDGAPRSGGARVLLGDGDAARALDKAALGLGGLARAEQEHRLAGEDHEKREAVHSAGFSRWHGGESRWRRGFG